MFNDLKIIHLALAARQAGHKTPLPRFISGSKRLPNLAKYSRLVKKLQ